MLQKLIRDLRKKLIINTNRIVDIFTPTINMHLHGSKNHSPVSQSAQ